MLWETLRDWLLFATVVCGGGMALAPAPRDDLTPVEAWCAGVGFAVGLLGGAVFAVYLSGVGLGWIGGGYAALGGAALIRRGNVSAIWHDATVRELLSAWALVSAVILVLLASVASYSGGAWMIDWEEHYRRARLFLHLQAEDAEFNRFFPFTARPPLANLADAAFLWVAGAAFVRHQVFMLLLNSLAFLPVALFTRSFGGGRAAIAAAAAGVLLLPLFLQNAIYPWTKLITAFLVLAGLHLLLARPETRRRVVLGFALLTLGMLAHYSACVWVLVFGVAWLGCNRAHWGEPAFRQTVVAAVATAAALFLPWLAYAIVHYGVVATFASNSTVAGVTQMSPGDNLVAVGQKLWYTIVPPVGRFRELAELSQANPLTRLRDAAFTFYQTNLVFAFGTPTLAILAATWVHGDRRPHRSNERLWFWAIPAVIVLGIAVHGTVEQLGVAHICLQPLVLLGVALAASRLPRVFAGGEGRGLGLLLPALATVDFALGIAMHFAACALQLGRGAGMTLAAYAAGLGPAARFNLQRKLEAGQPFLADLVPVPWWGALAVLLASVALQLLRVRRLAMVPRES